MSSSEEENAARKNTRRTRKRRYDDPEDHDDDNHDKNKEGMIKGARPRARLAPFETKEQDSMMVDPSMEQEDVDEEERSENASDEDDTAPRDATFHTVGSTSTSNTSRTTTKDENSPIPMSVDEDTIRIMVSTDNHLGYAERDPDRGMDSFAALEEVMYLAKHYQADMVLLGGDLFHENKPSRQTLHTTMDILRRYTMGPNPIHIRIVSSPDATPFRVGQRQVVNYEDEHYSVDLPIFAIHGNHDDPTRDGTNGELLSAMDFLDVCNFVNYFGRQDQVHQVQVAPIMIQKGETNLALYGLGHMRDERLNRMWQSKKVRFLRPQPPAKSSDSGAAAAEITPQEWFNLFVIHQNRDYGRGTKNCVHESMIPEWMDLILWGHEHECIIEPQESVVGTFRISQPGSSVAISLSPGEAVTKQVAILDVRGSHFRMLPIPLTQVRTMLMGDVSLNNSKDYQRLDPDDPKVDDKLTNLLQEQVQVMIHDAEETTQDALALASRKGNILATQMLAYRNRHANNTSTNTTSDGDKTKDDDDDFPLKNRLQKPNQPLIRLRVEHSGFSPVNNQRFGAKFVGVVANPTEILLFHRKREGLMGGGGKRGGGKDAKKQKPGGKDGAEGGDAGAGAGSIPVELQIEDLVSDELHSADKKLELMDNDNLNDALEEYVTKQQARALDEVMENLLNQQQRTLIHKKQRQQDEDDEDDRKAAAEEKDEPPAKKKKADATSKPKGKGAPVSSRGKGRAKKKDDDDDDDEEEEEEDVMDEDDDEEEEEPPPKARAGGGGRGGGAKRGGGTKSSSARSRKTASLDDDDDEDEEATSNNRRASPRKRGGKGPAPKYKEDADGSFDDDQEEDDDEVVEVDPPPKRGAKTASKSRPVASSKSRVTYNVDGSDEDQDVDEVDDDEGSMGPPAKRKPAARAPGGRASTAAKPATTSRGGRGSNQSLSQSQLSYTPVASQSQSQRGSRNNKAAASSRAKKRTNNDSDDDEDDTMKSRSYELDEGWGTATTDTFRHS